MKNNIEIEESINVPSGKHMKSGQVGLITNPSFARGHLVMKTDENQLVYLHSGMVIMDEPRSIEVKILPTGSILKLTIGGDK